MTDRGRPTKYNSVFHPALAESLALNGLTDKEMASKMGVSESTLNEWKKKYPDFSVSIRKGENRVFFG